MRRVKAIIWMMPALMLICGVASADVFLDMDYPGDPLDDGWSEDRFVPGIFESADFDGDERLHFGIRGSEQQIDGNLNYQGAKYQTSLEGPTQIFTVDLYLDGAWQAMNNGAKAGLWAQGLLEDGTTFTYPFLEFSSKNNTFTALNYGGIGQPSSVVGTSTVGALDYDQWHELSIELTKGTGFEFFVDGISLGSFAYPEVVSLEYVILNHANKGEDYDVYWDNFEAESVPEPMTLAGLGALGFGLYAARRKKRF